MNFLLVSLALDETSLPTIYQDKRGISMTIKYSKIYSNSKNIAILESTLYSAALSNIVVSTKVVNVKATTIMVGSVIAFAVAFIINARTITFTNVKLLQI